MSTSDQSISTLLKRTRGGPSDDCSERTEEDGKDRQTAGKTMKHKSLFRVISENEDEEGGESADIREGPTRASMAQSEGFQEYRAREILKKEIALQMSRTPSVTNKDKNTVRVVSKQQQK